MGSKRGREMTKGRVGEGKARRACRGGRSFEKSRGARTARKPSDGARSEAVSARAAARGRGDVRHSKLFPGVWPGRGEQGHGSNARMTGVLHVAVASGGRGLSRVRKLRGRGTKRDGWTRGRSGKGGPWRSCRGRIQSWGAGGRLEVSTSCREEGEKESGCLLSLSPIW